MVGLLRAFIAADQLSPLMVELAPGATGDAAAVKLDGRIVASDDPGHNLEQEAEAMETIRPLLAQRPSGGAIVTLRGGDRAALGYASLGMVKKHPEIDWAVLVGQDWAEASAPIDAVNLRALVSGLLAILLITAVAVCFTTHRPEELEPLEELLEEDGSEQSQRGSGGSTGGARRG